MILVAILSDPGCPVVHAGHCECVQHYTHACRYNSAMNKFPNKSLGNMETYRKYRKNKKKIRGREKLEQVEKYEDVTER
jgi:hypothetical protein